jgi:hypothetical protein
MRRADMRLSLFPIMCFALVGLLCGRASAAEQTAIRFDHVYVIVLENHDFDEALNGGFSPFLQELAGSQGLATRYYGVTHPSLPNYLAMIGGDDFSVNDDNPSCFASDLTPGKACHKVLGESLVDQLESAGLTFALYAQGLPAAGDLSQGQPPYPNALYAQKHNPFAYFEEIVRSKARLQRLKPLSTLSADLAGAAPNFVFIVPDQCHDGHGLPTCDDPVRLTRDYDQFVEQTVKTILASPNWTRNSAVVVTFDEGEVHKGARNADENNRIATVVVTKCGAPLVSSKRFDHYALLATIEDGFGLPRLRRAKEAPTMMDLFSRPCR